MGNDCAHPTARTEDSSTIALLLRYCLACRVPTPVPRTGTDRPAAGPRTPLSCADAHCLPGDGASSSGDPAPRLSRKRVPTPGLAVPILGGALRHRPVGRYVVKLIHEEDLTEVVLVGHSYAGLVVSSVANEVPERITHRVYLGAMVPEHGETGVDVQPMTRNLIDLAARSDSDWRIPPLPEMPPPLGLFGVTDPADVAWLRTMLSDQPVRCLQQPVRLDNPAADSVPRTHIHCVGAEPEGIVRRPVAATQPNGTPARIRALPTGHDCMITMPAALSELLLESALR
ncbi:alpha/beta fold hydrolase [Streptomyces sp. NPDC049970]|uniref:alpha/beta fold hydrolase n=1 Tax=Streptomyces sp. NPDC049970 TaxID=3155033 RepID=UPI003415DE01